MLKRIGPNIGPCGISRKKISLPFIFSFKYEYKSFNVRLSTPYDVSFSINSLCGRQSPTTLLLPHNLHQDADSKILCDMKNLYFIVVNVPFIYFRENN